MKTALAILVALTAALALAAPFLSIDQSVKAKVLYAEPEHGIVLARDTKTGRTFQFTLPADIAATLKAGDALDVDLGGMRVVNVKGAARTAQIREPDFGAPCCGVVAFATDSAALEALLRGLTGAEPVGANNAADPNMDAGSALKALLSRVSSAAPINTSSATLDFRSLLKTAEPVQNIIDPAEPVGAIVLLRDLSTSAYHVVAVSGTPPQGVIGSGATVAVDDKAGVALFRANNQTYSHPLYRPQSKLTSHGPWEVTPNAQLRGIQGRLITRFPQRTDGTGRQVYVYSPGTTEQVSYQGTGGNHELIEGEYDVKIEEVTLKNVPIKKGHETRILVGALTFAARGQNRIAIYDASGQKELFYMLGYEVKGMPAGTYSLKAGSRVVTFEIKDGEVTEL